MCVCVCVLMAKPLFRNLRRASSLLRFSSLPVRYSFSFSLFCLCVFFFTISTPFLSTFWAIFSTSRNQFSPRFNFYSFFSYSRVCPLMGCLRKLVLGMWESLPGKWRNGGQRLLLGFNHSMHTHINSFVTYTNIVFSIFLLYLINFLSIRTVSFNTNHLLNLKPH